MYIHTYIEHTYLRVLIQKIECSLAETERKEVKSRCLFCALMARCLALEVEVYIVHSPSKAPRREDLGMQAYMLRVKQ